MTGGSNLPTEGFWANTPDLYAEARTLVAQMGYATISLIQRHLVIGYRQATLLLVRLMVEGVVELRPDHMGKRKVIKPIEPTLGTARER